MNETNIKNIARLFTDNVNGIDPKSGGHNSIYLINGSREFALRLTPVSHRCIDDVKSEIDFMLYLKSGGVPLTAPLQGLDGEYCYIRQIDEQDWIVSAFEIAVGEDFMRRVYTPERLFEVGRTLGKIHKLSRDYTPANGIQPRIQWNQNIEIAEAYDIFSGYDKRLLDTYTTFIEKTEKLHKDRDSYGLIHGDYMLSNYFFDGNNITVFDFDNCEYSWYISDIAIWMLYFMIGGDPTRLNSRNSEAVEYFTTVMKGYLTENTISENQIANLDLFFKLREYNLLSYNLKIRENGFNKWQSDLVEGILDRVLNGKPFMDVDFLEVFNQINT